MIEKSQNKMMTNKDIKNKDVLDTFFFPDHCITVEAVSIEEATKKLQAILKEKK